MLIIVDRDCFILNIMKTFKLTVLEQISFIILPNARQVHMILLHMLNPTKIGATIAKSI